MKDTDCGSVVLRDVGTVRSGYTARGRLEGAALGVLAIQQGDFTVDGFVGVQALMRTDDAVSRHILEAGDVLFRSRGLFTTAWVVPEEIAEPSIAVMPLFVIRPNRAVVDSHYLAWQLNQAAAQQHFRQSSQGQTIQMISKTALEEAPVVLPPIERQRIIAGAAKNAAKVQELETRLRQCRHQLITLQLENAARNISATER